MEPPERMRRSDPEADWKRVAMVGAATVITVVLMIVVVEQIARQAVLVTSLAASTFLLYYQPLHRMNRFVPVVGGHLIAAGVGFLSDKFIPGGTLAPAVAITVTVAALAGLRIIHPPAVSTSVVFAYRPHEVSALLTFSLTLVVVVALAAVYLLLRHVIAPRRWAYLFGLDEHPDG
ncbi:HPP family protein [Kocuria sp. LHG3120]|uniref:HPP family protein n=1 Tax=Kocuria sp. LHG3120 TaxID=2804590 RepID=UPI003CE8A67C